MDSSSIIFYVISGLILLFSYRMLVDPNPIYSALYLAATMISLSALYFLLNAPFIAGVQLIVYAGAVMVLFVMVLMLFDLKRELRSFSSGWVGHVLKIGSAALLCGILIGVTQLSTDLIVNPAAAQNAQAATTQDLAVLLFTKYLFAFESLGLLLLLVAIGVVAVSRIKGGTHHAE